jgi:hypothetical protein
VCGALFGGMADWPGCGTTASEGLLRDAAKGAIGRLLFAEIRRNR